MKPKRVRRRLCRASSSQVAVRVSRTVGDGTIDGYPVAIGRRWLLVQVLDDMIVLDGYAAVRLADVVGVRPFDQQAFFRRALEQRGQWPPRAPEGRISLDRTGDLIMTAGRAFPLVTIEMERTDPQMRFIGVATALYDKILRLVEITPDAGWRRDPRWWRLKRITQVAFDGGYERALWGVAREQEWPALLHPARPWPGPAGEGGSVRWSAHESR
jgi:hypothetical protein